MAPRQNEGGTGAPRLLSVSQQPLIAWLRRGGPWGAAPDVVETHAALIFLTGDRAYKLKKAVDLGYLNFSTLERRHEALDRELQLNRRTAPNLYLRTLPVTRSIDNGFNFDSKGEIADWLLEMRRFSDDALLSARAVRGVLDDQQVEDLAHHIADFHNRERGSVPCDWRAAIARIADENARDLRSLTPAIFQTDLIADIVRTHERLQADGAATLSRQSADVRRCHGDMHLGNVFLDDGRPRLFDCIEFDDFYATMPPLYDFAFLLMDLPSGQ